MNAWNPRYVEYARVHGRTPERQLAHDEQAWVGGKMIGFLIWHGRRVVEFLHRHPQHALGGTFASDAASEAQLVWLSTLPIGYDAEPRSL